MFKINLKRLGMFVVAMVGIAMMTGCANMGNGGVYRSYYQDRDCKVYYVDNLGNRVYSFHDKPVYLDQFKNTPAYLRSVNGVYVDGMGNEVHFNRICR